MTHSPLRPKAVVSWSSGKDSAWALHEIQQRDAFDVVGVLTTVTSPDGRVSMHGVRESLLDRQARELGLPGHKIRIPSPCSNEIYDREMASVLDDCRRQGVEHVIFGDLFLEDIRAYREERLSAVGMRGVFPLWHRDTRALAESMIDAGLCARITCVDPRRLDPSLAGRPFDRTFLRDLPDDVDPCGENGEFHSVVTAGPMLRQAIPVLVGKVVQRDGFVFADIIPKKQSSTTEVV